MLIFTQTGYNKKTRLRAGYCVTEESGRRVSNPLPTAWKAVALPNELLPQGDVGGGGFEPPKASPTDLQSAPFDRSGTLPIEPIDGLEPPTG